MLRAGNSIVRRVRHRGPSLASFMVILLIAMGLSPAAAAGDTENQLPPAVEECVQSPTVACVTALAIETAQTIDDADERSDAFVLIAKAQRVAGDLPGARESLSRATVAAAAIEYLADHEEPAQARAFIDVARAQTAMGDKARARLILPRALASTDRIERPDHRAAVLSDISYAQRLAGDEDGAQETLSLSLAATDQIESDDSKLGVLSAIAKRLGSAGELQKTAEIVRKAHEIYARIGPASAQSYSSDLRRLVEDQVEAGDVDGALRTAEVIGDEDDYGRALALGDIAYALAAAGDIAAAFATQEHIRGAYPRFVVVRQVGVALAAAGDIAGATAAAARIIEIEEEETWWGPADIERAIQRSIIFRAIVDAHLAAGAFDKALGALEEIERSAHIANAAMAIAKAQMAAGDLYAARATVDTVCEHRRRIDRCVEALSALAVAHDSAGDIELAQTLVSLAWETAEWTRTRVSPRYTQPFVALWKAQMRMGDVAGARKTFATALVTADDRGNYAQKDAEELADLGSKAFQMGEHESAAQAFSQAMEVAADIEDSSGIAKYTAVQRANAFKNIGKKRTRAGDWRGAQKAFSQALINAAQLTDDDRWRVLLFRNIAKALASARQRTREPADDT